MKKHIIISIVVLIIATITVGVFLCVTKDKDTSVSMKTKVQKEEKNTAKNDVIQKTEDLETVDTSDWKTYRNEKSGFEVKYPKTWTAEEGIRYPAMDVPGVNFAINTTVLYSANVIFAKNQKDFSSTIAGISCENEKCTTDELKQKAVELCRVEDNNDKVYPIHIAGIEAYRCSAVNKSLGIISAKQITFLQNDKNNFYIIKCSDFVEKGICSMFFDNFVLL